MTLISYLSRECEIRHLKAETDCQQSVHTDGKHFFDDTDGVLHVHTNCDDDDDANDGDGGE